MFFKYALLADLTTFQISIKLSKNKCKLLQPVSRKE
jgi:hypothetical protein